jgi:ribose transport system substrate-binding protein
MDFAIVGHGGSAEIMDIAADPASPCIGTVSFHSERYGPDLLKFALPIVRGRSAPVVHYVPHEFVGKEMLIRRGAAAVAAR